MYVHVLINERCREKERSKQGQTNNVYMYPGAKVRVIARNYGVITRKSHAFSRVNTPFNAHFTP